VSCKARRPHDIEAASVEGHEVLAEGMTPLVVRCGVERVVGKELSALFFVPNDLCCRLVREELADIVDLRTGTVDLEVGLLPIFPLFVDKEGRCVIV
jgi:hypothetical protein